MLKFLRNRKCRKVRPATRLGIPTLIAQWQLVVVYLAICSREDVNGMEGC